MQSYSLATLADEHLAAAHQAASGRSAVTVFGGHQHALRQTLVALAAGRGLDEHESPGEATLQVVRGRVRLTAGDDHWDGSAGEVLIIPRRRHDLAALDDAVVLLTVGLHGPPGD